MSAGRCVAEQPTVFGFDDDELAVLLTPVPDLSHEAMIRVARQCPSQAITVVNADGSVIEL